MTQSPSMPEMEEEEIPRAMQPPPQTWTQSKGLLGKGRKQRQAATQLEE